MNEKDIKRLVKDIEASSREITMLEVEIAQGLKALGLAHTPGKDNKAVLKKISEEAEAKVKELNESRAKAVAKIEKKLDKLGSQLGQLECL